MFESLPVDTVLAKSDRGTSTRQFPVADTSEVVSVTKRMGSKLRMHPHSTRITADWRKPGGADKKQQVGVISVNRIQ